MKLPCGCISMVERRAKDISGSLKLPWLPLQYRGNSKKVRKPCQLLKKQSGTKEKPGSLGTEESGGSGTH